MKTLSILLLRLFISTVALAQTAPTKFGFGIGVGTSTSLLASWVGERWKFEPSLSFSYSHADYEPYPNLPSSSSTELLTWNLGLSYYWVSPIDKNLSFYYGPKLFVGTTSMKTGSESSPTSTRLLYGVAISLGGEYALSAHFTIAGQFGPAFQLTGNPLNDVHIAGTPTAAITASISSLALIRWYF